MNCEDFALIVIELARHPAAHDLAHAETCEQCAARLAEERAWQLGVRNVKAEIAKLEAPAHIEATLLAAFRTQTEQRVAQASKRLLIPNWRLSAVWAAALLVILLLGVRWINLPAGQQEQAAAPAPPTNPAPPQEVITASNNAQVGEPKPALVQRAKPRRRTRRAPMPAREATQPFYSLVAEGEMAPLESGRIVRIEVPAATLVTLGVPLTEATLAQPMQADLLLGQDGLARAIRFLPYPQTTKPQ